MTTNCAENVVHFGGKKETDREERNLCQHVEDIPNNKTAFKNFFCSNGKKNLRRVLLGFIPYKI